MNNTNDIFDIIIDVRRQQFEQIKREWGFSTVKLKEYLNGDANTQHIKGYAEILTDDTDPKKQINVNKLLPYAKKPFLYGSYAMWRLRLAIEAKAVIMVNNGDLTDDKETMTTYINECLHLYLRVNSLSFKAILTNYKPNVENHEFVWFSDMVKNAYELVWKAYNERNNNDMWKNELVFLQNRTNYYKPRRKQTLYHYQYLDFIDKKVKYANSFKEAYEYWTINVFPTLLDKYKEHKLDEYRNELKQWTTFVRQDTVHYGKFEYDFDMYNELINEYKKELDLIKIRKLGYYDFVATIKKLVKKMDG